MVEFFFFFIVGFIVLNNDFDLISTINIFLYLQLKVFPRSLILKMVNHSFTFTVSHSDFIYIQSCTTGVPNDK